MEDLQRKITLRPASDDDADLLYSIYASTRSDEVVQFGWDETHAQAFLRMQFKAREHAYGVQFPNALHSIIMNCETPAGRLIVDRSGQYIHIIDIAVLPQNRSIGIGSVVMESLQVESAATQKPLVLRVHRSNLSAASFYSKLGFTISREVDLMSEMTWCSPNADGSMQFI